MSKKNIFAIAAIVIALGMGSYFWLSRTEPEKYTGPIEKVRVGLLHFPSTSPMLVAMEKGYFADQGLDLDIKVFDSGKAALEAMLTEGNLDIINVAQTPLVVKSFDRQDFAIISGLSGSPNDAKILIRNDRGISRAADLKGKKVGVTVGTTGHYFFGLFLAQHGLEAHDMTIIDFPASALPEALRSGAVDAISSWEPHVYNAQKILGTNASLLRSDNTFRSDYYLVAFKDWSRTHPQILERFLRAIDMANDFIATHEAEAQTIVAKQANFELPFIQSVWSDYQFKLFLDQSIVLSLEQQARWLQTNSIVNANTAPNYLDLIYFDTLESVKPKAVTIIR